MLRSLAPVSTMFAICSVSLITAAPARAVESPEMEPGIGPAPSIMLQADNRQKALHCLTLAIAYEAGFEPRRGQEAVAEVVLNRTRHPAYPKSVCGVVFQGSKRRTGCQFTFTCDGALNRRLSGQVLAGARESAMRVMNGEAERHVSGATHYHADYVAPYWAPSLVRIGKIGAHIFYRTPGSSDAPARYAMVAEPSVNMLGDWSTAPDTLTTRSRAHSAPPTMTAPTTPEFAAFSPWGLKIGGDGE